MKNSTLFVSAAALILTGAAIAQFEGAYAPGGWSTVVTSGGGAVFAGDGSSLTITGSDTFTFGLQTVTTTHAVVGGGTWSFDWEYSTLNASSGFDNAYYMLNGAQVFLGTTSLGAGPVSGQVSIAVATGDIIGWRVEATDDQLGAGSLLIENFEIPAPGALALLGLAGLTRSRRRA